MSYTIGEAAKATGASKSTISRALKSGRISGQRCEDGSFSIEAGELHRVFPVQSRATASDAANDALRNPISIDSDASEVRVLQERIKGLQEQLRTVEEHSRETNLRLDQSTEQQMRLTLMLTSPAAPKPTSSLLARLFGR